MDGEFEDALLPSGPVQATLRYSKKGLYRFVWLDGSTLEQEPINVVIKIRAVSKTGQYSKPQLLSVKHAGVKKPWWRLW